MLRSADRVWLVVVVCVAVAAGLAGYTAATMSASTAPSAAPIAAAPEPQLSPVVLAFAGFSNDPKDYERADATITYNDNVRKGVQLRAKGDLQGALDAFSLAAGPGGQILEQPNYEIWADAADLYCRLGKKSEGRALINEFRCASAIMTDQKVCNMTNYPDYGALQVPDLEITPLCYQTVCNDPLATAMSAENARAVTLRHNRILTAVEAQCAQ